MAKDVAEAGEEVLERVLQRVVGLVGFIVMVPEGQVLWQVVGLVGRGP